MTEIIQEGEDYNIERAKDGKLFLKMKEVKKEKLEPTIFTFQEEKPKEEKLEEEKPKVKKEKKQIKPKFSLKKKVKK